MGRYASVSAGSGGAIVGTYEDPVMFEHVRASLAAIGSRTIKPLMTE